MPISSYRLALAHYAGVRRIAYDIVTRNAVEASFVTAPLRLTDIDTEVIRVWRATWHGRHPSGSGGWDWERIARAFRRRPAAFHLALWSGDRLCALAVGRPSAKRSGGVRHTLSVHYIEGAPERDHPHGGKVAALVIAAADAYGTALGASRLRLMDPVPELLDFYRKLGFVVAWSGGRAVYCEREITP